MEPFVFYNTVSDMSSGIECTLSKFVDNTKVYAAVNVLEGSNSIYGDIDRLERWIHGTFMKFNKAK